MAKTKTIHDLDADQRSILLRHFRGAVRARITQWDHERAIERLLDREVDLKIADVASCCNSTDTLSFSTIQEVLGE